MEEEEEKEGEEEVAGGGKKVGTREKGDGGKQGRKKGEGRGRTGVER